MAGWNDVDGDAADLVPLESSVPTSFPGPPERWARFGAALGFAATAGVGAFTAVALANLSVGLALTLGISMTVPPTILGTTFGHRWRDRMAQDAGAVPVSRWLLRFAGDGALFASGSMFVWGLVFGAGQLLYAGGEPWHALAAAGILALIAAPAGAVTLGAVGVPFALSLTRGRAPWLALAVTTVLAPLMIVASTFAVIRGLRLLD